VTTRKPYDAAAVQRRYGAWDLIPEGAPESTCPAQAGEAGDGEREALLAELGCGASCDACCTGVVAAARSVVENVLATGAAEEPAPPAETGAAPSPEPRSVHADLGSPPPAPARTTTLVFEDTVTRARKSSN
jgi:hypothetical protein